MSSRVCTETLKEQRDDKKERWWWWQTKAQTHRRRLSLLRETNKAKTMKQKKRDWKLKRKMRRQTQTPKCWWWRSTVYAKLLWRIQGQQQQERNWGRQHQKNSRSKSACGSKDLCGSKTIKKNKKVQKQMKKTSLLWCYKKHEIDELGWADRRNDTWTWRIQMGCSLIERDLETSQVRNLGNASTWEQESMRTNTV